MLLFSIFCRNGTQRQCFWKSFVLNSGIVCLWHKGMNKWSIPNVYRWASIMSFFFIIYWAKHPKVVIVVGSGSWKSSKLADCIRVCIWWLKLLADIHGRFIPCSYQSLKQVIKKRYIPRKTIEQKRFCTSGTIDQQIYIFFYLWEISKH